MSADECSNSHDDASNLDDLEQNQVLNLPVLTEGSASADVPKEDQGSELENFRQQWKAELKAAKQPSTAKTSSKNWNVKLQRRNNPSKKLSTVPENENNFQPAPNDTSAVDDKKNGNDHYSNNSTPSTLPHMSEEEKEQKARVMYIKGVELERSGKLYEAIQQYRKAMQLVPDIESRTYTQASDSENASDDESYKDDDVIPQEGEQYSDETDLYTKICSMLGNSSTVCLPASPSIKTHLSDLPSEIVEYILQWVIGGDLDMRSLHSVSSVCRGLFVLSRSENLWKKACHLVWGQKCTLKAPLTEDSAQEDVSHVTWREMFMNRPQPRYNGCYISKTSYFRSGECNFHDSSYQPWHLINYYRLFRLFPDGTALMLTTSDPPQNVVSHLTHKDPKHSQVLRGSYILDGPFLNLEFTRHSSGKKAPNFRGNRVRRRGQGTTDVEKTTLEINLELIAARRGAKNWFLGWRNYTITSHLYTGECKPTEVDVSQLDTFPQLAFSRVRSYMKESLQPLL